MCFWASLKYNMLNKFIKAIEDEGIKPPAEIIADGEIHLFDSTNGRQTWSVPKPLPDALLLATPNFLHTPMKDSELKHHPNLGFNCLHKSAQCIAE